MFFVLLSQTLTGKEIEIDIEPTDKVYRDLLFPSFVLIIVRCVLELFGEMFDLNFPSRWSGLKRGWRRKKGSLRSSRG